MLYLIIWPLNVIVFFLSDWEKKLNWKAKTWQKWRVRRRKARKCLGIVDPGTCPRPLHAHIHAHGQKIWLCHILSFQSTSSHIYLWRKAINFDHMACQSNMLLRGATCPFGCRPLPPPPPALSSFSSSLKPCAESFPSLTLLARCRISPNISPLHSSYIRSNSVRLSSTLLRTVYGATPLYFLTNELISAKDLSWYACSLASHSESRSRAISVNVILERKTGWWLVVRVRIALRIHVDFRTPRNVLMTLSSSTKENVNAGLAYENSR